MTAIEWSGWRRWSGKRIGIALLLFVVTGVGGIAWLRSGSRPQYRTVPVERGQIVASISATGTLNAVTTVQVGSQISGMIKELHADFNSRVEKEQLIARIAPEIFEAKLQQASAELESAQTAVLNQRANGARAEADVLSAKANRARAEAGVRDARIKHESRNALFKEGGISREERDSAQATFDSAVAQLDAAAAAVRAAEAQLQVARAQLQSAGAVVRQKQAAVRAAEVDLDHTYIRAPVNGVVIARNVDVGQTVAASLQAPTLFVIAEDLTKMQVDTNVDEADIARVRVGLPTAFVVDAYSGETFGGEIVQIRQAPISVQNVVTYNVVIAVENPGLKLMPGMTANVRIVVAEKPDVLKISNAALRFRPAAGPPLDGSVRAATGGEATRDGPRTIWVLAGRRLRPVIVRLGISDGTYTEVLEGDLREGEAVVVGTGSRDQGRSTGGPINPRRFRF
jgi:HlyD family secretion protein